MHLWPSAVLRDSFKLAPLRQLDWNLRRMSLQDSRGAAGHGADEGGVPLLSNKDSDRHPSQLAELSQWILFPFACCCSCCGGQLPFHVLFSVITRRKIEPFPLIIKVDAFRPVRSSRSREGKGLFSGLFPRILPWSPPKGYTRPTT